MAPTLPITENTKHFRWRDFATFPAEDAGELVYPKKSRISATLVGHRVYVHGYFGSNAQSTRRLACYSLRHSVWKWYATDLPSLKNHTTVLARDSLYVFSGTTSSRFYSSDIRRVDLITKETTLVNTIGVRPPERMFGAADYLERTNELIVFGGRITRNSQAVLSNSVWVNRLEDGIWAEMVTKGESPSRRRSHASCCVANKLFVYGGLPANNELLCDLHVLDCSALPFTWTQLASNNGFRRGAPSLSYVAGRLFLFGGFESTGSCVRTLSTYSLRDNKWGEVLSREIAIQDDVVENMTFVGTTSTSSRHSAVCVSKGIIFFGGESSDIRTVTLLEATNLDAVY